MVCLDWYFKNGIFEGNLQEKGVKGKVARNCFLFTRNMTRLYFLDTAERKPGHALCTQLYLGTPPRGILDDYLIFNLPTRRISFLVRIFVVSAFLSHALLLTSTGEKSNAFAMSTNTCDHVNPLTNTATVADVRSLGILKIKDEFFVSTSH